MSEKKRDKNGRWRSRTVSFRASEEEISAIDQMAKLSGLTKQEYMITRLIGKEVVIKGNPKVFKALKDTMLEILEELRRLQAGHPVDEKLLATTVLVASILKGELSCDTTSTDKRK